MKNDSKLLRFLALLYTTSLPAMQVTSGSGYGILNLTTTGTQLLQPLASVTLTTTGPGITGHAVINPIDSKEPTVTLCAADKSSYAIPYAYIADHSMVVALFAPSSIPNPPSTEKNDDLEEYQQSLSLYLKKKEEVFTATTDLITKCNEAGYLKTKNQLHTFITMLSTLHHKKNDITMRAFVTTLANTLINESILDLNDFVALWTTAQYLGIKPISAVCAIGLADSQSTLPTTLVLPMPLHTHLKAEQACKQNKDTTALFQVLDECCLLEDVKGGKPLTTAKIWHSWRQHPQVEELLTRLPRSQQKSELLSRYIIDHAAQNNFDVWYWYDQMLPGHASGSPRTAILSTLADCAGKLVKRKSKEECAALPEGYFKLLVRQAYLITHNTPLDNFPIEEVQLRFSTDTTSIILTGLNLTNLAGIDFLLALRNELSPIVRVFINNNQLTYIPSGFCKSFKSLQELNLANNKLSSLPEDFGQHWKYLQMLSLAHNELTHLPKTFGVNWKFLTWLNLENNLLANLPNGFGQQWKSLNMLKLGHNQIQELPAAFGANWLTMEQLDLEYNPCNTTPTHDLAAHIKHLLRLRKGQRK